MEIRKHENTKTRKHENNYFNYYFCTFVLLCFFVLTGCQDVTPDVSKVQEAIQLQQKKAADKASAMLKCQALCQDSIATRDFSPGPCLSNEIIPDWVCDVAHSPRQEIDNLPANQCPAFAEGKAKHFVEVDGNCKVIKSD